MSEFFSNQDLNSGVYKHKSLPIVMTDNFHFFRCVRFDESFYGKTISEIHRGNLRVAKDDSRYSNLFPGMKTSYWADSPKTARAEAHKWGMKNNYFLFWAYDDGSSFRPTVYPREMIIVYDGFHFGFDKILHKVEEKEELTKEEKEYIEQIAYEKPDCLAYKSSASKDGVCFLFFESGFKKLSLREVRPRLGDCTSKKTKSVPCAGTSDFVPHLDSYGYEFLPKCKIRFQEEYKKSDEYKMRNQVYEYYSKQYLEEMKLMNNGDNDD